jgi:2-polyprenyl-3-methyl-5-hydroxy-6-metoxy-1,4-benzoquinol methylase
LKYIESCASADNIHKYYIESQDNIIISVCRINIYNNRYLLEGLQTHRDYYRKGFATKLIDNMIFDLKKDGIITLYSEARTWNDASNQLQQKLGFIKYGQDELNNLYKLDIETYIKKQLFDHWASNYNKSVIESEKSNTYPFAGYSEIKYQIIQLITTNSSAKILDMGVGTGETTTPLYRLGYDITGIDLSYKMMEIAKEKMPMASFIQGEFSEALRELKSKYDYVIFSYSIHHLSYGNQIMLLESLREHLNDNGIIIIGDVSTMTQKEMDRLHKKNELIWDDEEFYPILQIYQLSTLMKSYTLKYIQLNEVAGLYQLIKK